MVNINISNRGIYTLIAILILIAVGGIVFAIGSGDWEVHGHTSDEVEGGGSTLVCEQKFTPDGVDDGTATCSEGYAPVSCHGYGDAVFFPSISGNTCTCDIGRKWGTPRRCVLNCCKLE